MACCVIVFDSFPFALESFLAIVALELEGQCISPLSSYVRLMLGFDLATTTDLSKKRAWVV